MLDLRSALTRFTQKRAARRTRAKLDALLAGDVDQESASYVDADERLAMMRSARELLAVGDAAQAMQTIERLTAVGHKDVLLFVLWAQAAAALGRHRDAIVVNETAIKLADESKLTRLAASCRVWHRELAWRVARDS